MKNKPYFIAVTGSHGCGKSTLVFKLAAHYKTLGHNVKIIQEVARNCPFPINTGSIETCLWIYHAHTLKEMEAAKDHDVIICDRSSYDSFVYANHFNIRIPDNLEASARFRLEHCYDKVIFIRPDLPLKTDGIRSPDQSFQDSIDALFLKTFLSMPSLVPLDIVSSQVFNKGEIWKTKCL